MGRLRLRGWERKLPGDALSEERRTGSTVDRDLAGVAVCLHDVLLRRRLRTLTAIGCRATASPSDYGLSTVACKTEFYRTRTDRQVTQPSSFSNSPMSTVTTR
jgi:hypothetical protein